MALPIIVAVGGALIRTTAKQLTKILRRFKGAKEVKNPSGSQIDKAQTLTKNYTNFNKGQQKVLAKSDTANPSLVKRVLGLGRTKTQKAMKPNPALTTGEAKRQATLNKLKGGAGATAVIGGGAAWYGSSQKKKKQEAERKLSRAELERDIERAVSQVERERKKSKTSAGAKDKGKTTPLKSVSVKGGDTLTALSKRHGVSLEKLKQLNPKVKPRQMQIGSRIKLR